ncbi:MAG: hypothetical protein M1837_002802 [Sclerophora amabilis]|nr:MAG: hypothetical protein M1837_002802 [Sclerophora amabilis]
MAHRHDRSDNRFAGAQTPLSLQNLPTSTDMSPSCEDDAAGEADEPPDERKRSGTNKAPSGAVADRKGFTKSMLSCFRGRKESLLTQALVKEASGDETEPEPEPKESYVSNMNRGMSTASTGSNGSVASTADLTSDGFTSPTRTSSPSPPLPPATYSILFHPTTKLPVDPTIADDKGIPPLVLPPSEAPKTQESTVEAGLGRKRCITFACGRKVPSNDLAADKPVKPEEPEKSTATEPPKRRCALRFVCPSRVSQVAEVQKETTTAAQSPTPRAHSQKQSPRQAAHSLPRKQLPSTRKTSATSGDNINLNRSEATRFHEFASSFEEEEEWMNESTVHDNRLTVEDTFKKENVIRRIGEEAEAEALEEDEEAAQLASETDPNERNSDESDDDDDDEALSDGGNETDDEEGFAQSDDDSDTGSDYMFWTPGRNTSDTPVVHVEHIRPRAHRTASASSIDSVSRANRNTSNPPSIPRRSRKGGAQPHARPASPELPDSTDFVCGTLDEDRPLEAAYMSCLEERKRSKHSVIPQDIDPSFPTSDPENDEDDEDDDDDDDDDGGENRRKDQAGQESDGHFWIHGQPDEHDDVPVVGRGRTATSRLRSPRPSLHSPNRLTSPPPPKRNAANRSPAPHFVGGRSPRRLHSPPPPRRLKSPPLPRLTSPELSPKHTAAINFESIARRPTLTHTKSLPRTPNPFRQNFAPGGDLADTSKDTHHRGAVDIYKGLEQKMQRRREKALYKHCHQRAAKEKGRKPRPGKGAERMRELGLEMADKAKGYGYAQPQAQYVLSI